MKGILTESKSADDVRIGEDGAQTSIKICLNSYKFDYLWLIFTPNRDLASSTLQGWRMLIPVVFNLGTWLEVYLLYLILYMWKKGKSYGLDQSKYSSTQIKYRNFKNDLYLFNLCPWAWWQDGPERLWKNISLCLLHKYKT